MAAPAAGGMDMTGFSIGTALVAAVLAASMLAVMLTYLARQPGTHPALRLWAWSYASYAMRQALNLAVVNGWPELLPLAECFLVLFAFLLLAGTRSEEHTSELQSLMRISYAVFCLQKK